MTGRRGIVSAIIAKDFRAFTRDRFFLFMSILGLVFYILIFWVLPADVDETISLGIVGGSDQFDFGEIDQGGEGLEIIQYDSVDALVAAVEAGDEVVVGMAFPTDVSDPVIQVYIGPGVPPSLRRAVDGMATEIAFAALGVPPPVSGFSTEEIVLGEDRAGDQVSLQEKFRPLLAFLVLIVESMALAGLVASEIQQKTVKAVTITPARLSDFLTAKAIFGTFLAFSQVVLLLIAIRGLSDEPVILLTAVLLGSVLATGVGLLAGSLGRDFVGIIFWSMVFLVPLIVPAMSLLFPGGTATWIKVIPSYPLAQVLVDVTSYGAGWSEAAPQLGLLLFWGLAALGLGWVVLGRKVQTL